VSALEPVLVGVLDEILAELKSINAKLAITPQNGQNAKVEVKTSTRGADVTVTVYETTDALILDQVGHTAVSQYRDVMQQLSAEVMASFVAEANRPR